MTDREDAFTGRLQMYLQHYDSIRQPGAIQQRGDAGVHWAPMRLRHPRLIEVMATIAVFAVLFVVMANALVVGHKGPVADKAHAISPSGAGPGTVTTPPTHETICSRLSQAANYDLFIIDVPGAVAAHASCGAAIAAAAAACPASRFVCAGVAPQSAEMTLISGFGTLLYPPNWGGYHHKPVWMVTWPMSCQAVAIIAGRRQQLGSAYSTSAAIQKEVCQYTEFVDAETGIYLFPVIRQSYPYSEWSH